MFRSSQRPTAASCDWLGTWARQQTVDHLKGCQISPEVYPFQYHQQGVLAAHGSRTGPPSGTSAPPIVQLRLFPFDDQFHSKVEARILQQELGVLNEINMNTDISNVQEVMYAGLMNRSLVGSIPNVAKAIEVGLCGSMMKAASLKYDVVFAVLDDSGVPLRRMGLCGRSDGQVAHLSVLLARGVRKLVLSGVYPTNLSDTTVLWNLDKRDIVFTGLGQAMYVYEQVTQAARDAQLELNCSSEDDYEEAACAAADNIPFSVLRDLGMVSPKGELSQRFAAEVRAAFALAGECWQTARSCQGRNVAYQLGKLLYYIATGKRFVQDEGSDSESPPAAQLRQEDAEAAAGPGLAPRATPTRSLPQVGRLGLMRRPEALQSLIYGLLEPDPARRLSVCRATRQLERLLEQHENCPFDPRGILSAPPTHSIRIRNCRPQEGGTGGKRKDDQSAGAYKSVKRPPASGAGAYPSTEADRGRQRAFASLDIPQQRSRQRSLPEVGHQSAAPHRSLSAGARTGEARRAQLRPSILRDGSSAATTRSFYRAGRSRRASINIRHEARRSQTPIPEGAPGFGDGIGDGGGERSDLDGMAVRGRSATSFDAATVGMPACRQRAQSLQLNGLLSLHGDDVPHSSPAIGSLRVDIWSGSDSNTDQEDTRASIESSQQDGDTHLASNVRRSSIDGTSISPLDLRGHAMPDVDWVGGTFQQEATVSDVDRTGGLQGEARLGWLAGTGPPDDEENDQNDWPDDLMGVPSVSDADGELHRSNLASSSSIDTEWTCVSVPSTELARLVQSMPMALLSLRREDTQVGPHELPDFGDPMRADPIESGFLDSSWQTDAGNANFVVQPTAVAGPVGGMVQLGVELVGGPPPFDRQYTGHSDDSHGSSNHQASTVVDLSDSEPPERGSWRAPHAGLAARWQSGQPQNPSAQNTNEGEPSFGQLCRQRLRRHDSLSVGADLDLLPWAFKASSDSGSETRPESGTLQGLASNTRPRSESGSASGSESSRSSWFRDGGAWQPWTSAASGEEQSPDDSAGLPMRSLDGAARDDSDDQHAGSGMSTTDGFRLGVELEGSGAMGWCRVDRSTLQAWEADHDVGPNEDGMSCNEDTRAAFLGPQPNGILSPQWGPQQPLPPAASGDAIDQAGGSESASGQADGVRGANDACSMPLHAVLTMLLANLEPELIEVRLSTESTATSAESVDGTESEPGSGGGDSGPGSRGGESGPSDGT